MDRDLYVVGYPSCAPWLKHTFCSTSRCWLQVQLSELNCSCSKLYIFKKNSKGFFNSIISEETLYYSSCFAIV